MAAVLLPAALAFLMFTVGLRLSLLHLVGTAMKPAVLFAGLAVQMTGLPVLAWLISRLLSLPADIALGLMVIAVCPGGITSNYVSLLAGADVALSTAMTLVTSVAAGLTIPLLLDLSGVEIGTASLAGMALVTTAVAAIPLLLGMAVRAVAPGRADALQQLFDKPAKIVFAGIVLVTFWQNRVALADNAMMAGPAVLLLNGAGIALALTVSVIARASRQQALAIAVETGLQNAAIAIFICSSILGRPDIAVPALLYAVVMNVTSLLLVFAGHRMLGSPKPAVK
jgi:BASS family bile acid:Na+ symporter